MEGTAAAPARELVVEGGRPGILTGLRELWLFRSLILAFAERDVRVKYKQMALGATWAILQPLLLMGIFSLAFGRIAGFTCDPDYRACVLATLVPWVFIATAVSFGANAVINDAALVRKIYFPREVPVLGSIAAGLVDLSIGLSLFLLVGPFVGARVSWTWILAIPLMVLPALLAAGVALTLAGLNVYYRDFRYILPLMIQIWLFGSPVVYPVSFVASKVGEEWLPVYAFVNPAVGVLEAFRSVLAAGRLPDLGLVGPSFLAILLVLVVGYGIFKRLERNFADVV